MAKISPSWWDIDSRLKGTPSRPNSRRWVPRALALAVCLFSCLVSFDALAWKPYTHVKLADQAKDEAVATVQNGVGGFLIRGDFYPLRQDVFEAIRDFPTYFDGGVIGPDGMPDITFGQGTIHPKRSGMWLARLLDTAYRRQGSVGAVQAKQELAFAYGFLSHGAGDMWGHSLVNDFAQGVFPAFGDIFAELLGQNPGGRPFDGVSNALRHMIVEQYVGDATVGFDGNPNVTSVNGDLSDDATLATPLNAPHDFVYAALIDPSATLPVDSRGPAIDFFIGLRRKLVNASDEFDPVDDIEDFVRRSKGRLHDIRDNAQHAFNVCSDIDFFQECIPGTDICNPPIPDPVDVGRCLAAVAEAGLDIGIDIILEGVDVILTTAETVFDATIGQAIAAYLRAWSHDIDDGLRNWNRFGLCMSQALFDAGTKRRIQNEECEFASDRQGCEAGVSMFTMVTSNCEDFLELTLLSMLGLPDAFLAIQSLIDDFEEDVIRIMQRLAQRFDIIFDPILKGIEYIHDLKQKFVRYLIEQAIGMDLDVLEKFMGGGAGGGPTSEALLDVTEIPPSAVNTLLGFSPSNSIPLFRPDDHERLDDFLAFTGVEHHVTTTPPVPGLPPVALRLSDEAEFMTAAFAAAANTVMQTRLLLLDTTQLNALFGNILKDDGILLEDASVVSFQDRELSDGTIVPANIMIDTIATGDATQPRPKTNPIPESWFQMMDGDHAWRQDGQPTFPVNRDDEPGGNGTYPAFDSCVLRPAFSSLFTNWEPTPAGTDPAMFPDFGDAVSSDPTDQDPPTLAFSFSGPTFVNGGTTFVGTATTLEVTASDAVFAPGALTIQFRAFPASSPAPGFTLTQGGSLDFTMPSDGVEGPWTIEFGAEDPCHTFGGVPAAASTDNRSVVLDRTPPVITILNPQATIYGTADDPLISATAVDPQPNGSGLASLTATLDGATPLVIGNPLDLFLLSPGPHTVTFVAIDNVGNRSEASREFRILATAQSLLQNLDEAFEAGRIPSRKLYLSLRDQLLKALDFHARGQLQAERSMLDKLLKDFINARNTSTHCAGPTVGGEPCPLIDPRTASLFIASISELIPNIGRTTLDSIGQTLGVLELLEREFLAGNVSSLSAYDQLRQRITLGLDLHYQGNHNAEQQSLRIFIDLTTALVALNQPSCASRELACFSLDPDAAARLRQAANAVLTAGR